VKLCTGRPTSDTHVCLCVSCIYVDRYVCSRSKAYVVGSTRPLPPEQWDRGFEYHSCHRNIYIYSVLSCVRRGLATGRSLTQGVVLNVYKQDSKSHLFAVPQKGYRLIHQEVVCDYMKVLSDYVSKFCRSLTIAVFTYVHRSRMKMQLNLLFQRKERMKNKLNMKEIQE
jgi:hypothetical protein